MSRQTSITCDQCGKTKGEANHWWLVFAKAPGVADRRFQVFEPQELEADEDEVQYDVCSEQCATILLGKWMRGELGK